MNEATRSKSKYSMAIYEVGAYASKKGVRDNSTTRTDKTG
jgi:hypothetical protein